ncbi:hypothetical protein ACQPZP_17075 [Spirillospora sp. CA-142024]|uniref:hypothetical protein n=1 Tax=Spirillospora sp. CA-142024 TaxID=3240036 RepID=UPI003D90967A
MNPNSHDIIGMALIDAFAQRGYQAALPDPDTVAVTLKDGARVQAGIAEWRAHAGRNPRSALPGIAAQYADQAVQAFERQPAPAPAGGRLDTGSLRVRLYPENALDEQMRAALVTRPLAPGLLQTVVVDHPDSIVPLNRADLGGLAESEAFGHALTQSIEREPHYVQATDVQGIKIANIGEQHRYIGAHVQVLRRYFPGQLPFGALVAFPLPEYVMVHEIGTEQHLVIALKTVQEVAARLAGTGERPISPQVYWWRPGGYEAMAERDALYGGRVPELRPVGVHVEQGEEGLKVGLVGDDTALLVQGWEAARG